MKRFSYVLILVLVIALISGCSNNDELPEITPGVPLMWHVTSPEGATMYLFGSIHVGNSSIYPLPQFIMDAFDRTDYLAVEFDLVAFADDFDAIMEQAMNMMYLDGRTLSDDIDPELHAELREVFIELSPEFEVMMDMFKPFAIPSLILEFVLEETSISSEYGIDKYFIELAMERGMDILEVESAESQYAIMQNFSMPLQIALLHDSLELEYAVESLYYLMEAWQNGSYDVINMLFEYDENNTYMTQAQFDEYNRAMMVERDIHMAQMARQYMADGKNVFFVMGLAHFVGDDSIVYLLRNYGYEVVLVT